MTLQNAARIFGIVFLLVGVLGFIPAATPNNHLLGLFHVNTTHNWVHLLSGLAALGCSFSSEAASRAYFRIFGVVYLLVAILGIFVGDGYILGMVANNMHDVWLHFLIAGASLYLGFAYRSSLTPSAGTA